MSITESVEQIQERIADACLRVGRKPDSVRLMAVSKMQPLPSIEAAWNAGVRLFGENRVQEADEKFTLFKEQHPELELHLIGTLQRNKTNAASMLFDCVQSVDREALIDKLGKACTSRPKPLPILLELHTGEDSKTGFPNIDGLCRAVERVLPYSSLVVQGLMTIAPNTEDKARIRASFRSLISAYNILSSRFPSCDWSCLSMGMSSDFETAIEEGSTLIRIGTAIFGRRPA
ncbi:MAG: YggS family pyridoxal phosphate-dependent enzyme [Spirochaetaceae bacterium]|jgi:pyridoxal phosphate enzyme (YggS family)|nr:YggS family pyridoxal phosphate-dependent enzyme [Spirochaetaceae bacterium]